MKINLLIITVMSLFLNSCFAPLNLTYESARTVKKGEIELQGNVSTYYSLLSLFTISDSTFISNNDNFGFKIGYGVSDRYTVKIRYERMKWNFDFENDIIDLSDFNTLNYFEIENKFKFKHTDIALGFPIGYYNYSKSGKASAGYFIVDPRAYFTLFSSSNIFELNIVPKVHVIILDKLYVIPAISIGLGFSSDLNKWAVRPEIGYDGYFSFGIGVNININEIIKGKETLTNIAYIQ